MNKPETGAYYYHYKHDPGGEVNNYAYEIMNIAHHTEIDGLEESAMVIYAPLYEAFVYNNGKHWDARPLGMFMEEVEKDGKKFPRFTKIIDREIITKLDQIKNELYS